MATRQTSKPKPRKPAETEREWWQILKNKDRNFIRSMDDWRAALKGKDNPLAGCDTKTVEQFTKNLRFNNGGLAHAHYGAVAEQLSYRQFSNLWVRFGLGMGLFTDYKDKECEKRATCGPKMNDICTSNC